MYIPIWWPISQTHRPNNAFIDINAAQSVTSNIMGCTQSGECFQHVSDIRSYYVRTAVIRVQIGA